MILSYILHGHCPVYASEPTHPDALLHAKLMRDGASELLDVDVSSLTEHFAASRLSYSTQALSVNVLLDTLVRPSSDVEEGCGEPVTNLQWRHEPAMAVPHLVVGNASQPGGQWASDDLANEEEGGSEDIQTLSYGSMLSLPGYSYAEHHRRIMGNDLAPFSRPARREFSDYLRAYPKAVNIDSVFRCGENVSGVYRMEEGGFHIRSHNIKCQRLVLASGIFSEPIAPPPLLEPLLPLHPAPESWPLLVIGSGFSAADAIIAASPEQKIIHAFKWDPDGRPSPLHGCHQQAYPEYGGIYRLMKRWALSSESNQSLARSKRRASLTPFLTSRNWDEIYEGLANVQIVDVEMLHDEEAALVTFRRQEDGSLFSRQVRGLVYAVGRRGNLDYLDHSLLSEVIEHPTVDVQSLRGKAYDDLQVARDVFIIGSLTGDSLIRFAYGGCVYTAGKLIRAHAQLHSKPSMNTGPFRAKSPLAVNGIDGHFAVVSEGEQSVLREQYACSA